MGYRETMELAGAVVYIFEEFGSYQGEWWAKVNYNDKIGWVNGSYGSCSGCDSFEAEFGYKLHKHEDNDCVTYYSFPEEYKENCPHCQDLMKRMKEFGEEYLDNIMTQEEAEKYASKYIEWDLEAQEMLRFLQDNKL